MPTYQVTAANCAFWQTLKVSAPNASEAEKLFRSYLESKQSLDDEEYEFELAKGMREERLLDNPDLEPIDRDDWSYEFQNRDIEETEEPASETVVMVQSGGNG